MPCSKQFVEVYGKYSFAERPFGDADALALCEVFYMPLEMVVSNSFDSKPVPFGETCHKLFALRGNKHKALGLMITATPSKRLMQMADEPRYSNMMVANVKSVLSTSPAVQFCAGCFILPDGTAVVVYRGTDDTIAGWKEDLDIYLHCGTPSYALAMEYLENVAKTFSGDIILCGHSKGGNVALKTACDCSDEIRERIKGVYNFDGPGYYDYSLFYTKAYDELLQYYRHYVPSSSFIGMLMKHDYDYKAVKSSKLLGPLQHDLHTWQIKKGELVLVDDTDIMSKIVDEWLGNMLKRLTAPGSAALDNVLTAIAEGTGSVSLTDVSKNPHTAVEGAVKAYKELDDQTKTEFKNTYDGGSKVLLAATKAAFENTALFANAVTEFVARKVADAVM